MEYLSSQAPPAFPHTKYADDTIYDAVMKVEELVSNSTAHKATISFQDNSLQTAALCVWVVRNKWHGTEYHQVGQKVITCDRILGKYTGVEENRTVKLLDVTFDPHMTFPSPVDNTICQQSAQYSN